VRRRRQQRHQERGAERERAEPAEPVPPPEMVRSRLMAFSAALQGLRGTDDRMPY